MGVSSATPGALCPSDRALLRLHQRSLAARALRPPPGSLRALCRVPFPRAPASLRGPPLPLVLAPLPSPPQPFIRDVAGALAFVFSFLPEPKESPERGGGWTLHSCPHHAFSPASAQRPETQAGSPEGSLEGRGRGAGHTCGVGGGQVSPPPRQPLRRLWRRLSLYLGWIQSPQFPFTHIPKNPDFQAPRGPPSLPLTGAKPAQLSGPPLQPTGRQSSRASRSSLKYHLPGPQSPPILPAVPSTPQAVPCHLQTCAQGTHSAGRPCHRALRRLIFLPQRQHFHFPPTA